MEGQYLYIPELDSVRKPEYEQLIAEQALYKALVLDGKKVVLSYNQVVDSVAFLCLFEEGKTSKEALLELFKEGRIFINQDESDMNLSKYI